MRKILAGFALLLIVACDMDTGDFIAPTGYKPVYANTDNLNDIGYKPARPILNAGKIYTYKNFIFQNERNEGIHVILHHAPGTPQKQGFLKIPYNTEMAIKGNYLYANRLSELLVFDISNPADPVLVKTLPDIFPPVNQQYPPFQNISFECADPSKGLIVGWEEVSGGNFKCRR